jgi:hypothetical protein
VKNSPLLNIRQDEIDRWPYAPDAYYAMKWDSTFAPDGTKIGKSLDNAWMVGKLK